MSKLILIMVLVVGCSRDIELLKIDRDKFIKKTAEEFRGKEYKRAKKFSKRIKQEIINE